MYATVYSLPETADWHANAQQRLAMSLLTAALIIGAVLSLFRLPVVGEIRPITELIVEIIRHPPPQAIEPSEPESAEAVPAKPDVPLPPVQEAFEAPVDPAVEAPIEAPRPVIDWMSMIGRASKEIVDSLPKIYTVNPRFDEKRRMAAEKYRPSGAQLPIPKWEDTEKDQLGRTVLQNGNCSQVLDDSSVIRRYQFETFDQHMMTCTYQRKNREGLPPIRESRGN